MKANGRRAWRRWAKARDKVMPNARLKRFVTRNGGDPDPPKRSPFSARSLVGMSMTARKRKALAEVADRAILAHPPTSYLYKLHRRPYRIGQRLRPCPGCCACKGNATVWFCHGDCKGKRDCDGSGVLPGGQQ